ncbi:3'-5' exonuclease (plasmid) [Streptomyces sp. NBC_01136]|uniref:3'-5' exonuclease n=1 Tax=Streptomyces sp. NBC_01136 TaxID=2903754 RepID=UPI002F90C6CE|nr:3'-5' exonuclease [Streptomyces sp. NBC_01136]
MPAKAAGGHRDYGTYRGLTVYRFWDLPPGLLTPRQLKREGLAVAPRQRPRAYAYWRYYGQTGYAPLYRKRGARPKRVASPAQLAALARARFVLHAWRCFDCGELVNDPGRRPDHGETGTCAPCRQFRAEARAAVDLSALAPVLRETLPEVLPTTPLGPQEWAAALLDSGPVVVLDTESTDLHRWVLELGVCDSDGAPLFSSLVNPRAPIAAGAVKVHGITTDTLAEVEAPVFSDVMDTLARAIQGRTVAVYNLGYDLHSIAREVHRHARTVVGLVGAEAVEYTRTWLGRARWVDLMHPYAEWYGQWHPYWQNYTWQTLPYGDHRAPSDAAGAARLLRELADGTAPRLPEAERGPWSYDADDDRYEYGY